MYERLGALWRTAIWVAVLTTTFAAAPGSSQTTDSEDRLEASATVLAERLLDVGLASGGPPFDSDEEHARSIDPVLTPGAAIWIHEALPSPPLTVIGGRVFTYRDLRHNPLDAPVLKLRPTDGDQTIPFLIRVQIQPGHLTGASASIEVRFPVPEIFDPQVEKASAWVGPDAVHTSVIRSNEGRFIAIRLPFPSTDPSDDSTGADPVTVIAEGLLILRPYRTLDPDRFATFDGTGPEARTAGLSAFGRDCALAEPDEMNRLGLIAEDVISSSPTDYQRIEAITRWTGDHLRYKESPATRSVSEILDDGDGDCDDYSVLTGTLLCVSGLPARIATGQLYDFNIFSTHAWVETALPTSDGSLHWFICDPTLAGTALSEEQAEDFVQFNNRILLYPVRPQVTGPGLSGRHLSDVLLNWRDPDSPHSFGPLELDRLLDRTITAVDREIARGAERLAQNELRLGRESATIPGSSYMVVDRPVREGASTRIQLRLENEERLALDLTAGRESALESRPDIKMTNRLRSIYGELNDFFFAGRSAHFNLELLFIRDRHSDRLHTVSLRIGRYLVENEFDRILEVLAAQKVLTREEAAFVARIAETSRNVNLYITQELAREITQ